MAWEEPMIELTQEQRQEVRRAEDGSVRLADPDTKAVYVIVTAERYERMRRVFEEVDPSLYEFEEIERP
jgi:hypothetical protein